MSIQRVTILLSIILCFGVKSLQSTTKSDQIFSNVDSIINASCINLSDIDRVIKDLQRINLSSYYEKYGGDGPLKNLSEYCRQKEFFAQEIACINVLGVMYRQVGRPSDSEKSHFQALELSKQHGDTINMMMSLNNLGVNARRIDDLKKASNYHIEVLNLSGKFSNKSATVKKSTCIALNSIGNINIALKQYDKAIEVFKQSNAIEQTMNSAIGQAINHANIGEAYELSGRLDSARQHYSQSLDYNIKAKSDLGIALCNNNLGMICLKEKKYDEAVAYFEKAIPLMRLTGDKYHLIISLQSASKAQVAEKAYHKASVFLDEAIGLARAVNARVLLKDGYSLLSKIKEATGDYKEALHYADLSHQHSDSIYSEENQRHLIDIQTRYETQQKEQQIVLLNRDNELKNASLKYQRLVIWSGSLLFLIIAGFSWFFIRLRRKRFQTQQAELEQKLLRSQMNPHFIFNSLGAIQSFMMKNDGRKAAFYLSSFSSLMRSILKNSREEWITLQEEKQTLENYLNLHQLRLGEKLKYSVVVSDRLEADEIVLPPMLIQPFVENAINHGIEKIESEGKITVTFEKEDDNLKISVDDNGPGIASCDTQTNHISYALQIFKERVANLKRNLGLEIFYTITDKSLTDEQNSGTLVTVKLKLKQS